MPRTGWSSDLTEMRGEIDVQSHIVLQLIPLVHRVDAFAKMVSVIERHSKVLSVVSRSEASLIPAVHRVVLRTSWSSGLIEMTGEANKRRDLRRPGAHITSKGSHLSPPLSQLMVIGVYAMRVNIQTRTQIFYVDSLRSFRSIGRRRCS